MSLDKREIIVVMNSATWESIKNRTIEEAYKNDDPIEYLARYDLNIVVDDDLEDGVVQTWFKDVYEAYLEVGDEDDKD